MCVADDKRDRHGFAQGATETQHDPADRARTRPRQHHALDDIPLGCPQAVSRFLERSWRQCKHFTHHRGDEGQHHDGQYQTGGQQSNTKGWALEQSTNQWPPAEVVDQPRLHVTLQEGRKYKQPPDAEHDARNRRQQFDSRTDGPTQPHWASFSQEDRHTEANGDGNQHRDS